MMDEKQRDKFKKGSGESLYSRMKAGKVREGVARTVVVHVMSYSPFMYCTHQGFHIHQVSSYM